MIELKDIEKIYPDGTRAVDNISLRVYEGEVTILVGPSGCGKTTTMKLINRLYELTSGKILVKGQDIQKIDPIELRRDIGYVIQEIGLFPHMTIADNIATVPQLKKWDKKRIGSRVEELLELMGLDPDEYRGKYPAELSGGQKQRIGVARALASDPPILLMDEPFGALDPITRERLQDEFLKLQEKLKKTIVFVTHDIDEAIKMGNRVAVMKNGELIQYATPGELLREPANEFVSDFVGSERTLKRLNLRTVAEAMIKKPRTVKGDNELGKIKKMMDDEDVNYLLVTDESNRIVGWIHAKDFKHKTGKTVKDILSKNVISIEPDASLKEALSKMLRNEVGNLPVVTGDNELVGMLTFNDIQNILGRTYTEKGGLKDGVV